jgi:lipopolysaccharide/colanic/teichoic acid biosynthesis glycosyltransferase
VNAVKRMIDVAAAISVLAIGAPVIAATAALVYVDVGRPLLFRQDRVGLGGRIFELMKFRTMRNAVDASGRPLPDNERVTAVGRFLRASSLDELPQLVNVLRGDMSLVGPRPLLMEYLPLYSAEQQRRHDVRPGLTGLAQVGGRNALNWDAKFALDIRYVDHWSLMLDWKILAATAWQVVTRRGISHEDHPTAPRFEGNRSER